MKKDGNDEDVALRPAAISPNTRRSVVLLRRVLRLIHCLQQERGASCASCAGKRQSSATANPKWIMAKLERTRSDTNRALEQLLQSMPSKTHSSEASEQQGDALLHHHPARSNLFTIQITVEKLRNMMDAATESPTLGGLAAALDQHERSTAPPSFRRILVSFSTIISAIIYDFIPPRRRKQRKSISSISPMLPRFGRGVTTPITNSRTDNDLDNNGGHGESTDNPGLLPVTPPEELQRGHTTILPISLPTTTSSSTPGFVQGLDTVPQTTLLALPRICSHGELTSFQSTTTTSAMGVGVGSSHHRQGSEGYLSGPNFAPDVLVRGTPSSLLSRKESNNISSVSDIRADTKVGTNRPLVETTNKALYDPIMEDISDVYFLDQNSRMLRLLDLMSVFVKLKESTGVERAMITSMLVLNQDEARLFLNDVVLEIENQRRLRDDLVTLPTGLLRNLVVELISLSEQMEQVQNSILNGFSLEALKENYDSDKLWSVMTVYIDKLHSLELLITEEIECCLPASSSGSPPRSPKPTTPNATPRRGLSLEQPLELAPPFMEENLNAEMKECANLWNHTIGTLGTSMDDIQSAIESMSAEDVKRLILTGLRKEDPDGVPIEAVAEDDLDGNVDGTLSSKKGVDDLLKELCNAPATKEWEIDIYELRFLKRIGQGSAGTTYIAEWSGLTVAVKVASINEMGLEGWRTEVQALQKLHHPNIIRLLGSVYHPQPLTFCLVLEYCDAGDLASALLKVTPRNFFFLVSVSIAKGLTYLHNRGIIHRDIKPSNVLLHGDVASGNLQVKVTDFGVATDLDGGNRTAETGTYRWMAPEVIRHESYDNSADVYSFAIVLWQLITREEPFANLGQIEAAVAASMESGRPPFPPDTPRPIQDLIEQCWDDDPRARPSFEAISKSLEEIKKSKLTEQEIRWLEAPLGQSVYKKRKKVIEPNTKPAPKVPDQFNSSKAENRDDKRKGRLLTLFARKSTHF